MIAIVDSGGANIASVVFAFERLGATACLTADKTTIQQAKAVILPGVGAARDAMEQLTRLDLIDTLRTLTQPVLGICLGQQLLYAGSEEGNVDCLGIIPAVVKHFPQESDLIVPHMGWNTVRFPEHSPLFRGISQDSYVYFTHSYYAPVNAQTAATTEYGISFTAACQYKNFYATQFHPERSGAVGSQILQNFLEVADYANLPSD